ncbi:MAG TPA: adenylate/guanylate cyclase domain-containing protein [Actinomycetota bacterium]|nr:adenylate/guanylate cyclase domain-containing protein [Actinomycetota bacterium]
MERTETAARRLWIDEIERLDWSAAILDDEWRLHWVSPSLMSFLGAHDPTELGYGLHMGDALLLDPWLNSVAPESQVEIFRRFAPYILGDLLKRRSGTLPALPEYMAPLLDELEPAEAPAVWSASFAYVDPGSQEAYSPYRVNALVMKMHEGQAFIGWLILFFIDVQPNLLSLLARGDQSMYARMARLVEPGPRQGAALFCDLHSSVSLSRRLSSYAYFRLVRRLWTGIDQAVADELGIVGKHAGDGASAYFLTDDLGDPSSAAAAAIRTARCIHSVAASVSGEHPDAECLMRVGVHWGGSMYMGQLVPGGRLDVTALGDEVNEAARVQEAARPGHTLVSKELVERLSEADARELGIDPAVLTYRPLGELAPHLEKVQRDAGSLPVFQL